MQTHSAQLVTIHLIPFFESLADYNMPIHNHLLSPAGGVAPLSDRSDALQVAQHPSLRRRPFSDCPGPRLSRPYTRPHLSAPCPRAVSATCPSNGSKHPANYIH